MAESLLTLRNFIMTMPYKTNGFVGATGGSIYFGDVKFKNGVLYFENSVYVSYHKISEFADFVKRLGSNIVCSSLEEKETTTMELNVETKLVLDDTTIIVKGKKSFALEFDHFVYIHFLKSLSRVALFVLNPSKSEFEVFQQYVEAGGIEKENRVEHTISRNKGSSEEEKFLLSQLLAMHSSLLNFCILLNELSAVNV